MKKLSGFIVLLVCGACGSVYVPTVRNAPLFSEKGEFQSTISGGNGINVTAAYAFTSHLAISVGGLYANNKNLLDDEDDLFGNSWRVHQAVESALGYFGNGERFAYELFAGFGAGSGKAEVFEFGWFFYPSTLTQLRGRYQKGFFQPSLGYKRKRIHIIGTFRYSYIDFKSISIKQSGGIELITGTNFSFWEPSFTVKVWPIRKVKPLFVFGQVGINILSSGRTPTAFTYSVLLYNVGVGCRLMRNKK